MNTYLFTFSAVILYLACAALLFFHLKQEDKPATEGSGRLQKKQIVSIGLAGLLLHVVALFNNITTPAGIDLGFYNAISLVSASIVFFTLIATWRYPVESLAIILLPITCISMAFEFNGSSGHLLAADSSKALIFHISMSIIAYSLLALAALQAVLLSIQNKFLHAHQPGGIIKLMPPLRNMEVLLFEVIVIGFIALTIALGSGLIFLDNMFAQQLAHKTILSILAWLVFLILLIGHWKLGWRGRTAIRWTLSGFISLMLAYFGSKFVLEILLT